MIMLTQVKTYKLQAEELIQRCISSSTQPCNKFDTLHYSCHPFYVKDGIKYPTNQVKSHYSSDSPYSGGCCSCGGQY